MTPGAVGKLLNTLTYADIVMKKVIIDPVTRIEGHAKISIYLDDDRTSE